VLSYVQKIHHQPLITIDKNKRVLKIDTSEKPREITNRDVMLFSVFSSLTNVTMMILLPDKNKVSFNKSGGGLVFSEKNAHFSFFSDKF